MSDLTEGGGGALLVTRVQSVFEPVRHAALTAGIREGERGANDPKGPNLNDVHTALKGGSGIPKNKMM